MTSYFDNIGKEVNALKQLEKVPEGFYCKEQLLERIEQKLVDDMDLVMPIPDFPAKYREAIQEILIDGCVLTLSSYVQIPERYANDEDFDPFQAVVDLSERLHTLFHELGHVAPVHSDKPPTWIRWHTMKCAEERERKFRELGRYKPPPGYEVEEGGDGAS